MANQAGPQASIGNGQTLNADAAVYWHLLIAAVFARVGVWVVATEGTRTWARQFFLWQNRNRPGFNPAWHPDDVRANHVAGRCVDVGSNVGYVLTLVSQAFYALAGAYGFRPTIKGEPWHFEWRLEWVADHIKYIAAVNVAAGTIPIPLEDDMFTDDDRKMLRETYNAVFNGGPSMPDGRRSVGQSLADLRTDLADTRRALGVLLHRVVDDVPDDGDTASLPRLSRRLGTLLRDLTQVLAKPTPDQTTTK